MRKLLPLLLLFCALVLPLSALADTRWDTVPEEIRPGKSVRLTFTTSGDTATVYLEDGTVVRDDISVSGGTGTVWWDGTVSSLPLQAGEYTLCVLSDGQTDKKTITIGPAAPVIESLDADEEMTVSWEAVLELSMDGTLTVDAVGGGERLRVLEKAVEAGEATVTRDELTASGDMTSGSWELEFALTDATGFSSNAESVDVTLSLPALAHDVEYHTPNERSKTICDHDVCFWKMEMGNLDEDAVWSVLTQPVTVLSGSPRDKIKVRAEPSTDCTTYTGEVTCDSQAVHILETDGDWTKIEAYSSSEEGSKVKVWALPFEGWVKTKLLEEKQVSQKYGIVIDKLQQRLYLFKEGKLYSTLLCSTGFPRDDTPFNETPAGEYVIVSWTGGFWSGNLFCDLALRINDGILLHEVPCTITTDELGVETRDYYRCELYLGEKASHGCIRIQRQPNAEGINMKWLWENLDRNEFTKVIIWDEIDRVLDYPDDDVVLYYNPDGGKQYHSTANCPMVLEQYLPLTPFLYGQLDEEPYASLTRCPGCAPQLRHEDIDTVNEKNNREVPW